MDIHVYLIIFELVLGRHSYSFPPDVFHLNFSITYQKPCWNFYYFNQTKFR